MYIIFMKKLQEQFLITVICNFDVDFKTFK